MDYVSAKRIAESGIGLIAAYDAVNDELIFLGLDDNADDCADKALLF